VGWGFDGCAEGSASPKEGINGASRPTNEGLAVGAFTRACLGDHGAFVLDMLNENRCPLPKIFFIFYK